MLSQLPPPDEPIDTSKERRRPGRPPNAYRAIYPTRADREPIKPLRSAIAGEPVPDGDGWILLGPFGRRG